MKMRFAHVVVALIAFVVPLAQSCIPDPRVGVGRGPDQPVRPLPATGGKPRSYAALTIESLPSGAVIYLDSQVRGITPMRIDDLPPGIYEVQLRLDGYKHYDSKISLREGEVKPLQIKLKPLARKQEITPVVSQNLDL